MFQFNIDVDLVVFNLVQLGLAFLLALPVALNRESSSHGAGLRTFPLVALASCGFMLVALSVFEAKEHEAQARVMYGIITGIGFIGGGAIFKHSNTVHGTATAAGIWNTGAIGISVAYQRYEIALLLSLFNFFIFQFGALLKKKGLAARHKSSIQQESESQRDQKS